MTRSKRLRLASWQAAGVATAAVPVAATAASASASPGGSAPSRWRRVSTRPRFPARLPSGAPPETVSFILKANNLGALEAKVAGGAYNSRNFLLVKEFAAQ